MSYMEAQMQNIMDRPEPINDGGPAFPNPALADEGFQPRPDQTGAKLRDYFAAKVEVDPELSVAYATAIIGREMPDYARDPIGNATFWADFRARMRFIEADAMIRARGAA